MMVIAHNKGTYYIILHRLSHLFHPRPGKLSHMLMVTILVTGYV